MPELPEVEAIRTQLDKFLKGHEVLSIDVRNTRIFPDNPRLLINAKILKARRFGKVVVVDFDNGYSFICHVKLTGQLIYRGPNLKKIPELSKKVNDGLGGNHTHVIFHLDKGGKLYYNDVRRFGWIKIEKTSEVENESFISKLGPEPLKDLSLTKFKGILAKTRRAVKVVIMDQSKMGGVGNIYANDALWDSKVLPSRPANNLTAGEAASLYKSIEKVLKKGLETGGASELAFVTPDGTEGSYQDHTLVYGKEGTVCARCKKNKIEKYMLGGRGTYFCPFCQK
jgi:formamidopyrimidine-DNA glycosylase